MNTTTIGPYLAQEHSKSLNSPEVKFPYILSKGNETLPFKTLTSMSSYAKRRWKTNFVNEDNTALSGIVYLYKTSGDLLQLSPSEFLAFRSEEDKEEDEEEEEEKDKYEDEDDYIKPYSRRYRD